ncbi:GTP cyclohydrolase II RibA [Pseudoalteromonas sp. MMG005]|uniref:GTP cyclohydrolase II RibA n=1 Tax=Pseudoalteromonas sp. MMG005 TaxID=2822682 RepID=UPI001B3A6956|nr:GTP cyclohydrolase II RibA [Pseudoalteromonas sp. MMG005]MBQ4847721.1 GTP cyclohydrolase II RibA [Pseudoalteromonas sp. MMG005]
MRHEATTLLPTELGTFSVRIYRNKQNQEVTAICAGDINGQKDLPVRVHSACFTAEALGSLKCDCKQQLDFALDYIAKNGGVVLYLPQEGRGIGLSNKIRAYALQEKGHNTIEANRILGLPIDSRTYEDARDILNHLNVISIRLLTNNPLKLKNLSELGITVSGRIPIVCEANFHSAAYLETKQQHMGHLIKTEQHSASSVSDNKSATDRPFIHVNFAIDSQACTAGNNGESISISCPKDWQRVHELREKYCAVAVGAKTWLNDTPKLTARHNILGREPIKQPARIIFSGQHYCPLNNEQNERKTYIIGHVKNTLTTEHTLITALDHQLAHPLAQLNEHGIQSILVEGGLQLVNSFIKQGVVDLLTIYVRTVCITSAIRAATEVLPGLAADEITACSYGEGILLSASMSQSLHTQTEYGVAI